MVKNQEPLHGEEIEANVHDLDEMDPPVSSSAESLQETRTAHALSVRSEVTVLVKLLHGFWQRPLAEKAAITREHLRDGRFQRSLSLVAGASSLLSGMEVTYEHYRGSYGQKIMWTPVILSTALAGTGVLGCLSPRLARSWLRWTAVVTLADCAIGFGFHVRGIARKPGGWRMPVANIVMGPPIFAPLLFGVSAYLGLIASFLRPEEAAPLDDTKQPSGGARLATWSEDIRHGRFQKHLARATALSAFFSGFEALYSHYKTNFKYKAQWTPVIIAPLLMVAALASMKSKRVARTALPAMSLLAVADGAVGFYYHARGVARRPGGLKKPVYNVIYGPPIFAPLLFAACGALGLLTHFMRREDR